MAIIIYAQAFAWLYIFAFEQTEVKVEDVRKAQPDAIARASDGIASQLEENGEKLTEALRSLCWRHKGIQAEVRKLELYITYWNLEKKLCSFHTILRLS